MLTAERQYAYFENLERMIKGGVAFYVILLVAGCISGVAGSGSFLSLVSGSVGNVVGAAAVVAAIFAGVWIGTGRIAWLGEIHIWLDRTFFGFLGKSNEIIFDELIFALDAHERVAAGLVDPRRRGEMAHSIFSQLASDHAIFEDLLRSGIFRYWIWYWIMIYGTFAFILLTAWTLVGGAAGGDPNSREIFSACWMFSFLHLAATLVFGITLVRMTKRTVEGMVLSHGREIAAILREKLSTPGA